MSQPIRTYTDPVNLELSNMVIKAKHGGWEIEVGGVCQPRWFASGESFEDAIRSLVYAVTADAIQDEARAWEEAGGGGAELTRTVTPEPAAAGGEEKMEREARGNDQAERPE